MNFDHIDRLLVDALPWLSVTLFPVLLILAAVFGTEAYRLGDENVHDVDDYKPAPESARERRRLRPVTAPWTPPYAMLTVAQVTRRYGDSPEDTAARFLREIAAEAVTR